MQEPIERNNDSLQNHKLSEESSYQQDDEEFEKVVALAKLKPIRDNDSSIYHVNKNSSTNLNKLKERITDVSNKQNNLQNLVAVDLAEASLDETTLEIARKTCNLLDSEIREGDPVTKRQFFALALKAEVKPNLKIILETKECTTNGISSKGKAFSNELKELLVKGERDLFFRVLRRGIVVEDGVGNKLKATITSFFSKPKIYNPQAISEQENQRFKNVVKSAIETIANKKFQNKRPS